VFGVVGLVWIGAHTLGLLGSLAGLTFVLLALATVVSSVVGVRRYRPSLRWPWWTMSGAVIVFMIGGGIREAVGSFGDLSSTRSFLPDYVVVPGYVVVAVSIGGFVHARWRGRGRDLDAVLDSLVASLAALTVAWVYLMTPLFEQDTPVSVRLSLAIYPPLSVFIAALTARIAFTGGGRMTAAQRLFMAAMLFMVLGDVLFTLGDARLVQVPQRFGDGAYALAFLAMGVTFLHPTMRGLSDPVSSDDTAPGRGRLALVAVSLVIPAVVSVFQTGQARAARAVLVVIVLSLTVVVVFRVFRALRQHADSEARFAHLASHDRLTGLPNRTYVLERIGRLASEVRTGSAPAAVIFLDVDGFKLVNDSGGHSLGDELLVCIAQRLKEHVRPGDVVARIGGDEFIIVLQGVVDQHGSQELAERICRCFIEPFAVRGADIYSSASLGLVFIDSRNAGGGAESFIRDADTAMYQAKAAGRDGVAVFDTSMRDRVAERITLEQDLRHALDDDQLHVHFQPIVEMGGDQVDGFEALLRWTHPTRGLVAPVTFIPIAEDTGLIVDIGAWVIDEAARELARWRKTIAGGGDLYVAVNLSARQLRDPLLIDRVAAALSTHGLPGDALCLELTESLLMEDPVAAAAILHKVRGLGVRLSIDDFGTGYSSLSYLKRFPVDHVKIDRSFVECLGAPDTSEESLVAAIIAMASALGMTTVAEGVETVDQAGRLRMLGADRAQGYLFSRPLAPDLVPETLARLGVKSAFVAP